MSLDVSSLNLSRVLSYSDTVVLICKRHASFVGTIEIKFQSTNLNLFIFVVFVNGCKFGHLN